MAPIQPRTWADVSRGTYRFSGPGIMLVAKSDVLYVIRSGSRHREQVRYRGRGDDRAQGVQGLHPARERGRAGGGRGDRGGLRGRGELDGAEPYKPPDRPGRGA